MTTTDAQGSLMMAGVPIRATLPLLYDASYARPSTRWLTRELYPWFKARLSEQGLANTRRHDCDNFARKFCVAAQDAHALTAGNDAEGLAVGEFLYHSAKLGPHAVVVAIIEDNEIAFLEPQTGELLNLTPSEISSCFALIM